MRSRLKIETLEFPDPDFAIWPGSTGYLGDQVGGLLRFDQCRRFERTSPLEHNRTIQMFDETDPTHSKAREALRVEYRQLLSDIRRERDAAIEEERRAALTQLKNAEAMLQAALNDYRYGVKPEWPRIVFAKRSDFPETRLTHDVAEKLLAQCLSEMKARAGGFWDLTFIENAFELGLYTPEGEIDHTIMVRNRFRRVLRKTQADYQRRLALEQQPGFNGKRQVSFDNWPFVMKALDLAIENQKYWEQVTSINQERLAQLNEASLKRTLWYAERRKAIKAQIAVVAYARSRLADVANIRKNYDLIFQEARATFERKMVSLESSLQYSEYRPLLRLLPMVNEEHKRFVTWKGQDVAVYMNAETSEHYWAVGSPQSYTYHVSVERFGTGRTLVQPNTIFDDPWSRGSVGELLARLGSGKGSAQGTNVISMIFELRDLPKSIQSLKRLFSWAKSSYSARTLKGVTFKSIAESFLEYSYGIAPTVDTAKFFLQEFHSLIEWLRIVVDPSSLLAMKIGATQSASQKILHESDVAKNEPIHWRATRYIEKKAPIMSYGSDPSNPVDLRYGLAQQWFSAEIGTEDFLSPDVQLEGGTPYCLVDYMKKSFLKVFARPVRELAIGEIRKKLFTDLVWDNSLAETLWNAVPFSFIADWFFGLKDVFRGLDQLAIAGWRGLEQLYQPWFRRIDEAYLDVATPWFQVGHPTVTLDAWQEREPEYDKYDTSFTRPYAWRAHMRATVTWSVDAAFPWVRSVRPFRKVIRNELPSDTNDLLVDAFKGRVVRAFKLRPASGRLWAISSQVTALGVANGDTKPPKGRKPVLHPQKGLSSARVGPLKFGPMSVPNAIRSSGFQI